MKINHLSKQILIFLALIFVVFGTFYLGRNVEVEQTSNVKRSDLGTLKGPTLAIGNLIINLEIADTPELRTLGLSGHSPLSDSEGMLFVFEKVSAYHFWMKDMLFPLDIIWLEVDESNKEGSIVDISRNVLPESYPKSFSPSVPVRYVLEVNANLTERNNWKIGDRLKLSI